MHTFDVFLSREVDTRWKEAEKILLNVTERVCQNYLAEAKKAMDNLSRHTALDTPSVEPRVSLAFVEGKQIKLTVRVASLPKNRWKIEQALLKRFKERLFNSSEPDEETASVL